MRDATISVAMISPEHPERLAEPLASPHQKIVSPLRSRAEQRVARALGSSFEHASWAQCRRVGSLLGLAFFALGRKRRELAIANVRMALGLSRGAAQRIARRSAQNWGMTTGEFLHLPGASEREIRDYVLAEEADLEALRHSLSENRGAIFLMAHLGNWEVIGARLAQELSVSAIVRPLSNASMQKAMSDVRRSSGLSLISKHGAARPALKALRSGSALCILPDRHAGAEGALLPLFGRETRFETAPARLALMSGAPIIPVWGVRREPWLRDGRIQLRLGQAFSVRAESRDEREQAVLEGTRGVIASIEEIVRAHPDQWSWMLRRWRDTDA